MRELAFERMVQRGLADMRTGQLISNKELEHRMQTWRQ